MVTGTHLSLQWRRDWDALITMPCHTQTDPHTTLPCRFDRDPLLLSCSCDWEPTISVRCHIHWDLFITVPIRGKRDPVFTLKCSTDKDTLPTLSCRFERDQLLLSYIFDWDQSYRSHAKLTGTHLVLCHPVGTGTHMHFAGTHLARSHPY